MVGRYDCQLSINSLRLKCILSLYLLKRTSGVKVGWSKWVMVGEEGGGVRVVEGGFGVREVVALNYLSAALERRLYSMV